MIDKSIYEVTRNDYIGFLDTIKPEYRNVKCENKDEFYVTSKVYSKLTGKCLCGRVYDDEVGHEKYYIYASPEAEESRPATPVYKLELETKEEVQSFFDFLAKQNKEKKND